MVCQQISQLVVLLLSAKGSTSTWFGASEGKIAALIETTANTRSHFRNHNRITTHSVNEAIKLSIKAGRWERLTPSNNISALPKHEQEQLKVGCYLSGVRLITRMLAMLFLSAC